ncbi:POLY polymerase [Salix purpurea]|uniref:POLY polymerase n=1 Tax=Salix purpurea TaxID=77065 RepID=A0A9Q0WTS9_SALPP|nr:POLY polymerase [Salix purpurea]
MGGCFSSSFLGEDSEQARPQTAKVISIHGDLREYNLPAFVSQVLQAEIASSSSSSSSSWFLCNSDLLLYDEYIPVLDSDVPLHADQIYFVLPKSKLQHRLTSSDMAAWAVKASLALQNSSNKDPRHGKKARISPVLSVNPDHQEHKAVKISFDRKPKPQVQQRQPANPIVFSRSGSVRRFQKYTSRRAKLAVRSFKLRLTTIYEGTVL